MMIFSKIYHDWHFFTEKVKDAFIEVFSFTSSRFYIGAAFFLNSVLWLFSWLFYNQVRGELIILHYNVDFGVDFFGQSENIFAIPALGLFFLAFNFLLAIFFVNNKNFNFICHLALGGSLFSNIILSLAFGPVYLINFT